MQKIIQFPSIKGGKVAVLYMLFAGFSIIINIGFQVLSLQIYQVQYDLYVSILAGTFAGLLVKYELDKRYIFKYHMVSISENSKTFFLYSIMGVGTTLIFWGFELLFEFIFETKLMRYIGAVIGLSIGYYIKYHLDKRYVFRP